MSTLNKMRLTFIPILLLLSFTMAATTLPERPAGPTEAATPSARIVLSSSSFESNDWTVVQWQSADGNWYDVSGWQGNFLLDGTVLWWVGADQLGQQNFRWLVYDDESRDQLLHTSATFNLPTQSHEVVTVATE